jgi:hypothetical protein
MIIHFQFPDFCNVSTIPVNKAASEMHISIHLLRALLPDLRWALPQDPATGGVVGHTPCLRIINSYD